MASVSSDAIKPEIFDGAGFKRWQARAKLWLIELGLFWAISEEMPPLPGEDVTDEAEIDRMTAKRASWEKANTSALARILAILSNSLFDVYVNFTEAHKIWIELNEKYAESDNGNESFITAKYLNYQMVEGRSIMEQIHELQLLVRDLGQYECVLPEGFQVNAILAKLPSSWRDFVTARRHLKKRLIVGELVAAINVEEKSKHSYGEMKAPAQANLVEHKTQSKNMKKIKKPSPMNNIKTKDMKKKKTKIVCFVCGVPGHKANRCRNRRGKGPTPEQQKASKAQVHVAVAETGDPGTGTSTSGVQQVEPF